MNAILTLGIGLFALSIMALVTAPVINAFITGFLAVSTNATTNIIVGLFFMAIISITFIGLLTQYNANKNKIN